MHLSPASAYLHNWHIDKLAENLSACEKGEIKRLIINLPPRSLKSIITSVAWPCWLLGHNPARKIICASYSKSLAVKHSEDCRKILSASWYKEVFPSTNIVRQQNSREKFVTSNGGFRLATSVYSSVIGEGADFLILDDPQSPRQAASPKHREQMISWFESGFLTRLNSKRDGVAVIVMQRLHENDITGHLLLNHSRQWQHLKIPAIGDDGLPMHPEREDLDVLERLKLELGSFEFESQYQQNPTPREGRLIKPEWLQRYRSYPAEAEIIQSWDTGIKAGDKADPSCVTTWAVGDNAYFLLDVMKAHMEYPELKRAAVSMAEKWNPNAVLIEDKASGQSLLQDLKRETMLPVIGIKPKTDKVSRLSSVVGVLESGRVKLPNHAPWLAEFEAELFSFPSSPHDDQVDSLSQALIWLRERQGVKPGFRVV